MTNIGYWRSSAEHAPNDHIYIHQVRPHQEGFFRFYEEEVLPVLSAQEDLSNGATAP